MTRIRPYWMHEFSTLVMWLIAWTGGQSLRYFLGTPANVLAWISVFALGGLFAIAWFAYVCPERRRISKRYDRAALLLMVGGFIAYALSFAAGVSMNEWLCAGIMWLGIAYQSIGRGEERKPLDKSNEV